ncbi:MAG: type IV pilus twitching motility protein PilT [Actinobacteria bacterium]|nr:type IV pilus twitching motility protein PilT [Actinomycetota bacterium]
MESKALRLDINELLKEVLERGASDLHLTVGVPPVLRINGVLQRMDLPKMTSNDTRDLVYSILTARQREALESNLEFDLSYSVPGSARFRVNAFFQRNSVGAAFRIIPYRIKTVEELRLPLIIKEFARLPRGFVLVTGPTGQGKSTTLATIVDLVNSTREEHIITVEDPIEFLHVHKKCIVNQREVGSDTHSFANALKFVLRQDPDVILIGEMRDLETISTALTAAETGHLVFATLHTQDAPQSIDRIIDVFPTYQQQQVRLQLSTTLQAIVTQQLVPTKDRRSRVAACEIMIATAAIRNMIRDGKVHQIYSAMQAGGQLRMQTMDASLASLFRAGQITFETGLARSHNKDDFRRLVGQ